MSSALFAASFAVVLHANGPLPTIEQLIERLHAPRRGITSFEVVIDAKKGEGKTDPHIERVWCDGGRYREDFLSRMSANGSVRTIDATNLPKEGMFFTVRFDPVFEPSKVGSMLPVALRKDLHIKQPFRFEDLGATPEKLGNQAHGHGIEWHFGLVDETRVLTEGADNWVERIKWKDRTAFKLVLNGPDLPRKPAIEVTILPDRGFAAVSARATWDVLGRSSITTSESDLIRVSGMWLPKSSVHRKFIDGKKVAELTQTIDYVRLNKSPDPKVFTLEGMDLIRGTLVGTEEGLMVWDGSKLVPHRKPN